MSDPLREIQELSRYIYAAHLLVSRYLLEHSTSSVRLGVDSNLTESHSRLESIALDRPPRMPILASFCVLH